MGPDPVTVGVLALVALWIWGHLCVVPLVTHLVTPPTRK
jgi:hypothetical protein